MNENSASDDNRPSRKPLSITAEEFDAKIEAGEDISDYIDWESGIVIGPNGVSPRQKLAMGQEAEIQELKSPEPQLSLHISLPPWAVDQLQQDASRQGIGQEELAQLFILQRLDKQRNAA